MLRRASSWQTPFFEYIVPCRRPGWHRRALNLPHQAAATVLFIQVRLVTPRSQQAAKHPLGSRLSRFAVGLTGDLFAPTAA